MILGGIYCVGGSISACKYIKYNKIYKMTNTQRNYRFLFLLVFSALMGLITRGLTIYYGITMIQYIVICLPAVLTALVVVMLFDNPKTDDK